VVWARTLVERLETKTKDRGIEVKIGLLPALAGGDLKNQVKGFRDELDHWVKAESHLAGYTLHIGPLHSGTPWLRLEPDGRVRFLLPDRLGSRVRSLEGFTYRQSRDARAVASDLLRRVERSWMGCSPASSSICRSGFGRERSLKAASSSDTGHRGLKRGTDRPSSFQDRVAD
jgi:hypothetical protein